ncbi:MAG: TonB-dependent receptor [Bacteroidales bacterium]|nr:TonB-dependent receptor [Bacteroidales bacterium]
MIRKLYIILSVAALALFPVAALSQDNSTVKGVVKDVDGNPIPGVFVNIQGTSKGVSTDLDGAYTISAPSKATLEFICIGYTTLTIPVGNQSVIDVTLSEDTIMLEETVVVGYGTQRKIDLTGAVEQVGSDVFVARPNANVTQMLEGAIPNLNISLADGKPIRTAEFNVRGTTSIGQGGSALILVDGVEGDPSMLNPDDIASVSVLKDAASSAIYGSRAPYGVVLITTKNASKGRATVSYSNNFTFAKPVVKPQYVTDGYTWAEHFYLGYYNYNGSNPTEMNSIMPFSTAWLSEYRNRRDLGNLGTVVSDGSWRTTEGSYVYFAEGTDWFGLLYRDNSFAQTHNLSVSGSTDKFEYYVSGRIYGYYGLYNSKTNTDDCFSENLRVKVGYQAFPWLKISNNFEQGHRKYNNPFVSGGGNGNIWAQINASAPVCSPFYNPDGTMTEAAAMSVGGFLYGHSKNVYETDYVKNTIALNATFFDKALSINGDFTYKINDYNGLIRLYPDEYSNSPGVISVKESVLSSITRDHKDTKYLATNVFADFTKTLGRHYIKAMVGYNYEQSSSSYLYTYNTDVLSEDVESINLTFGTDKKTINETWSKWRAVGVFTRLNYSFADRYLIQFNGRLDGSSKFPSDERWAFFPSVSVGWRITEEPWLQRLIGKKWLSNAKVRFSYGSLGNSNISPYYYDETFNVKGRSRLLNGTIYRKTSDPDPIPDNLTWETSTTYNGGLDFGFFEDRLTISADTYLRKTVDMFTDGPSIQAVYGADPPKGNYAALSTRGYEISVQWKDGFKLLRKPFNYSIKATLADYVSVVDKYNNATKLIGGSNWPEDYYEGMTIGEVWGFVSNGLWQSQEEIDAAEAGAVAAGQKFYDTLNKMSTDNKLHPGDVKIEDLNGNGYIDRGDKTVDNPGDRRIIGNDEPRYIYSFTISFDWYNFYASVFFQGVGKRDYLTGGDSGMIWGQYNRQYNQIPMWQIGNYWTEENTDAFMPRYSSRMTMFYEVQRRGNTRYMIDASYIRLKNVQVGYNLPEKWIKPLHLSRASIFFSGENLWDWSPMYKHYWGTVDVLGLGTDPENSDSTAGSGGCYPIMASYSFGISLTF